MIECFLPGVAVLFSQCNYSVVSVVAVPATSSDLLCHVCATSTLCEGAEGYWEAKSGVLTAIDKSNVGLTNIHVDNTHV